MGKYPFCRVRQRIEGLYLDVWQLFFLLSKMLIKMAAFYSLFVKFPKFNQGFAGTSATEDLVTAMNFRQALTDIFFNTGRKPQMGIVRPPPLPCVMGLIRNSIKTEIGITLHPNAQFPTNPRRSYSQLEDLYLNQHDQRNLREASKEIKYCSFFL